jgi:hypothetical protein
MTLAYSSPADLLNYRDAQFIGELCTDERVGLNPSEILTNARLLAIMAANEGEVEAALLMGGRYTPAQLLAMSAPSKAFLVKLICIGTLADLLEVRPEVNSQAADFYQKQKYAYLEDLRKGKNLFNLSDSSAFNAAAVRTDAPTVVEFESLNTIPDRTGMNRHYPPRSDSMPYGR